MKHLAVSLLLSVAAVSCCYAATDYTRFVNPLMGTQSSFDLSAGNTYPAIARPWGMNFWTPQTGKNGDGWQYTYDAHTIRGFKQTHQPSPWINDYGCFSIMPTGNRIAPSEKERRSWFSHKSETSLPHYYSVYLADHDVRVEMTPTERAVAFRFDGPEGMNYFVVDAFQKGHCLNIEGNRITGLSTHNHGGVPENFANHFVVEFDRPIEYAENRDSLAIVGFNLKKGDSIGAIAASSFISQPQAMLNIEEVRGKDFDVLVEEGKQSWNDVLGRIDIDDDNIDNKRTFYSCLYRSLLFPRKFHEVDAEGKTVHYSPYDGKVHDGYMYTDTGFWDTFRSLFPLLNLMYPTASLEMQEGFLNAYRESGYFPEWCSPGHRECMVGNNSASVLADAWLKGIRVSDPETLLEGLLHGAANVHPQVKSTGRIGHEYYNSLGYVPYNVGINENAARTLEYAYDDWCIHQLGKSLGRPTRETDVFARRAMNYRNLFDKEHSLMRGRNADGSFAEPFSPFKWGDAFTEGNAWHYTWSVFHDPEGLKQLMGGDRQFTAMLDSVFTLPPVYDDSYYGFPIHEIREMTVMDMGNYAHGNQPIQHMPYLYDWTTQPWKTQFHARDIMRRLYSATPDGYCGDEDNGQTSAWYVFSALGFYPVAPVSGQYAIGSPLFKKATLRLENGNILILKADNNSFHTPYIGNIRLNGRNYDKNYLTHETLMKGGVVDFDMSSVPNESRGKDKNSFPYSFSTDEKH